MLVQLQYTLDSNDTIVGISVANVASATINVSVYITSGGNDIHLIKDTPIVQGSALQIIDGGVVLFYKTQTH